jgi:hypothetical protein
MHVTTYQAPPPPPSLRTIPTMSYTSDDDRELEALGYVPSFKREFSNLATVRLPAFLFTHTSSYARTHR